MLNRILEAPGISRTTTALALATQIPYRVLPLVAAASTGGGTPLGTGEPGRVDGPPEPRQRAMKCQPNQNQSTKTSTRPVR